VYSNWYISFILCRLAATRVGAEQPADVMQILRTRLKIVTFSVITFWVGDSDCWVRTRVRAVSVCLHVT
jgi:hypothetical protein